MSRPNLVFLSGDMRLIERLQGAVPTSAVMALDPRQQESTDAMRRLSPQIIAVDAGGGASSVLDTIATARGAFPVLPLVAIGDEMSAQLILAAFRAGVDDFIDRDASDAEIRACVMGRLRDQATREQAVPAALVSILSPAPCEEDCDLAFNIAGLIAEARSDSRVLLLDLSLPVSPARIALGLDPHFTVAAAIRDMARLDRTFLESALSRATGGGPFLLPLAVEDGETDLPALRELTTLVQMLRALFDTVVVHWGAFSRHGLTAGSDHSFVCCNQRFSSVRNAKRFLEQLKDAKPVLVVHQLDAGLVPAPLDVIEATAATEHLVLRAGWGTLALAHNRGRPLALGEPCAYGDALRTRLVQDGLLPRAAAGNPTLKLLNWLRR
jgi:pilus assembly protein CpaE